MIVGIGVDVVLVERFAGVLTRTPLLADRLFTEAERVTVSGNPPHRSRSRPGSRPSGGQGARRRRTGGRG